MFYLVSTVGIFLNQLQKNRIASLMEEIRTYGLIIVGSKGNDTLYELFSIHFDEDLAKKLEEQISLSVVYYCI